MNATEITLPPDFVAAHLPKCKPGETVTLKGTVGTIDPTTGMTLKVSEATAASYGKGTDESASRGTKTKRSPAVVAIMGGSQGY